MKITNAGLHLVVGAVLGFLVGLANRALNVSPLWVADICVAETVVFAYAVFCRELWQAKRSGMVWSLYWSIKLLDSVMDVVYSVAGFWILVCVYSAGGYLGNVLRP